MARGKKFGGKAPKTGGTDAYRTYNTVTSCDYGSSMGRQTPGGRGPSKVSSNADKGHNPVPGYSPANTQNSTDYKSSMGSQTPGGCGPQKKGKY